MKAVNKVSEAHDAALFFQSDTPKALRRVLRRVQDE